MTITIDGTTYDVPFVAISRKADILFKYAERSENGRLRAESIGTFYNFDLQCGQSRNNATDYAALWVAITSPDHEHEITMPDGESGILTFDAYFANISDDVKSWKIGEENLYRQLSFSVIALSPARTP